MPAFIGKVALAGFLSDGCRFFVGDFLDGFLDGFLDKFLRRLSFIFGVCVWIKR